MSRSLRRSDLLVEHDETRVGCIFCKLTTGNSYGVTAIQRVPNRPGPWRLSTGNSYGVGPQPDIVGIVGGDTTTTSRRDIRNLRRKKRRHTSACPTT